MVLNVSSKNDSILYKIIYFEISIDGCLKIRLEKIFISTRLIDK